MYCFVMIIIKFFAIFKMYFQKWLFSGHPSVWTFVRVWWPKKITIKSFIVCINTFTRYKEIENEKMREKKRGNDRASEGWWLGEKEIQEWEGWIQVFELLVKLSRDSLHVGFKILTIFSFFHLWYFLLNQSLPSNNLNTITACSQNHWE